VSLGGDFGPHDGTSDLEAGLAAFVGADKPGRAIAVAAGNSGARYRLRSDPSLGPLGVHTEVTLAPGEETRIPILGPGSRGTKLTGQGLVWLTFDAAAAIDVELLGPAGEVWVDFVPPG